VTDDHDGFLPWGTAGGTGFGAGPAPSWRTRGQGIRHHVVGDSGEEKNFKVKKKHFDELK